MECLIVFTPHKTFNNLNVEAYHSELPTIPLVGDKLVLFHLKERTIPLVGKVVKREIRVYSNTDTSVIIYVDGNK